MCTVPDPGHLVLLLRRGAGRGQGAHAPRVRTRIIVPLLILAMLAVFAGLVNIPRPGVLRACRSTIAPFEHYVEPPPRLPSTIVRTRVQPPRVLILSAYLVGSTGGPGRHARLACGSEGQGAAGGLPAQQGRPPATGPQEQVLLGLAVHRRDRGGHEGPGRPRGQLSQPERDRRRREPCRRSTPRAESGSTTRVDQGVVDTLVKAPASRAEGNGTACWKQRTARSGLRPACSETPSWPPCCRHRTQ